MPRSIVAARDAKTVPIVRSGVYDAAATYIKGAVLGEDADGELIELSSGAGVTGVVGVALEDVGSKPGFNVANDDKVVFRTGASPETSIIDVRENPNQTFSARLTDGTGVDVTPTQSLIGEQRGLLRLTDGTWTVNNDDTTNDAVVIVDIAIIEGAAAHGNYVLFKFLDSVISQGA